MRNEAPLADIRAARRSLFYCVLQQLAVAADSASSRIRLRYFFAYGEIQ